MGVKSGRTSRGDHERILFLRFPKATPETTRSRVHRSRGWVQKRSNISEGLRIFADFHHTVTTGVEEFRRSKTLDGAETWKILYLGFPVAKCHCTTLSRRQSRAQLDNMVFFFGFYEEARPLQRARPLWEP